MESHNTIKEIVEEYGLQSVSIKTNIPTDALKRLMNGELKTFSKMQVLGFAKIMEREFSIDLTQFKNDIREYYVKNVEMTSRPVLSNTVETSSDGFFSKLFLNLFIAILLYGAWYIYQNFYKQNTTTTTTLDNGYFDIEKNQSSLQDKKENIYSIKVLEEKKKTTVSPELNRSIVEDSNLTIKTIEKNATNTTIVQDNTTIDSNLTTTFAMNEANEANEANETNETNETKVDSEEENSTIPTPIETLMLVPSEKIWFRLTNKKSHRYKTYANQTQEYPFDLSADWLMIVKKGSFTFIDNHTQKEYNVTTLSYFKIDKVSGATQLSQEEYKKFGGYGL